MTEVHARTREVRDTVTWGVLGTANIAAAAFLPALRATGGVVRMVGSRDATRASAWAMSNEVPEATTYDDVLTCEEIDAVYIALPNHLHVTWAERAIRAGKAVLCEKPLGLTPSDVSELLTVAGRESMLWEGFVFPFHPQTNFVMSLIESGRIGTLREIISEFHFTVRAPDNIRLRPEYGGGALYDVGCYPIRLARMLTGREPASAVGVASVGPEAVDVEMAAVTDFPDNMRLIMSAGLRRPPSTFTRILGTDGEIRLTNPFHPSPEDSTQLLIEGNVVQTWTAGQGSAFEHAIRHVQAVLRGEAQPRHLAVDDAFHQAEAVELIQKSVRTRSAL